MTPDAITEDLRAVQAALAEHDLLANALELDTVGYTVVPPEKAAPAGFVDEVRERLLDVAERREGARPDVTGGSTHENHKLPNYYYLLFEDPIFEQLLMQPSALALVTQLCGWSCVLSTSTALIKGPSTKDPERLDIALHCDTEMHPPPFPLYAQYANATWLLSDYSREGGSLGFVPGSHLLCRQPNGGEGLDRLVPLEAPAGSLVVWHGNTWHGAYRRQTPGLRMAIAFLFARRYLLPREPYREDTTPEMLDRNPPRFATLMGQHVMAGWRAEGPDYSRLDTRAVPTVFT
ncbi:MAG TPA: phytanoyl-CoA dioxygenase family protein [Acidimicrobiales bacterium]|nr:phytanoyl-CoA dioxygenase family protein [Acidimicrobiales bacterium]